MKELPKKEELHKPAKPKSKQKRQTLSPQQRLANLLRRMRSNTSNKEDKHKPVREVIVDPLQVSQVHEKNRVYCTNKISTTKYNLFNFLPKSLLIQFMRASNCYFLLSTVLVCIPGFSPLPSYTSIGPLAFVLVMSMLREAYEDYKRYRNDSLTNNQRCKIMRDPSQKKEKEINKNSTCEYSHMFHETTWANVKCGDLILIEEGENFPADMILLKSSADNGECFVQTSNLDGERALKHKQCLSPIADTLETHKPQNLQMNIHCEQPNKNLYAFNGYVESTQFPTENTIQMHPGSPLRTVSLDHKQIALRGSNLANTDWVIGTVIYTGVQSKLMLNQGVYRFKQSKVEKLVNIIVVYLVLIQFGLCLLMSIMSGFYTDDYAKLDATHVKRKAEYIFFTVSLNSTTIGRDISDISYVPTIEGLKTFAQYYILLNTLIPISLVVSIEFVKLIQTPFLNHDIQMYDEISMKQCTPVSLTLHEELGYINYIFADKTGTLTSNIMQFMACSIGSVCYDEDYKEEDFEYIVDEDESPGKAQDDIQSLDSHRFQMEENDEEEKKMHDFEEYKQTKGYPYTQPGQKSKMNRRNSATEIIWDYKQATDVIKQLLRQKKYFMNDETNLGKTDDSGPSLILQKQNEYMHYFWLNIALCHDVIATKHKNGALAYQGTSPDEITLLDASKEIGYMFADRSSNTITIELFGQLKTYKLLLKIEFTSDRKKMTVVVEDPDTGLIILFSKGADLAILQCLSYKLEQHFLEATKEDLIKFSTKGYRTLVFGIRVLDRNYFFDWLKRYESAKLDQMKLGLNTSKEDATLKGSFLGGLEEELENELFLLGATALEDKLQDGVPEAIEDFHHASIKVWMLTGDKLETAENIGFSSKMFNEKMYIFKLQTIDKETTKERLKLIEEKIVQIQSKHSRPIVGTQFVLNPNAGVDFPQQQVQQTAQPGERRGSFQERIQTYQSYEARNIIKALEEYQHGDSKNSEFTLNETWARRPIFQRKTRKRLEEIVPNKSQIVQNIIRQNQLFGHGNDGHQYIPKAFDMTAKQYIIKRNNVYRSTPQQTQPNIKHQNKKNEVDSEDTFGIIIEGQSLHFIMDSNSLKQRFLKILSKCQAVVVCRASPSQKALVVQMVKENEPLAITLAIGDGANDVNMIQKAHIGIGIFGKEGYQAAGSSDYAIGQFKFLRRLMFVHGRWNGIRLSNFMLLFFQKNLVFTLPQFWFGWQSGFSGQTFFEDAYLTMFNTMVTAFAIGAYAVWDQDINYNDPQKNKVIDLFFPYLYKQAQAETFTRMKFFIWFGISVLQSLFIYGIPVIVYNEFIFSDGKTPDLWTVSMCSYFALAHLHYVLLMIYTKNWTIWIVGWFVLSYSFFNPIFMWVYNSLQDTAISERMVEIAYDHFSFRLISFITLCVCLLPIYFYMTIQSLLFPSLKDLIIQDKIDYAAVMREADPKREKAAHDLLKQQQLQQIVETQNRHEEEKENRNMVYHQRKGKQKNKSLTNLNHLVQTMNSNNRMMEQDLGDTARDRFDDIGRSLASENFVFDSISHDDGDLNQEMNKIKQYDTIMRRNEMSPSIFKSPFQEEEYQEDSIEND